MSENAVAVDTDRCGEVVSTWRQMVGFVDRYPRTIGALVSDLSLDGFGWSPVPLTELVDELGRSAHVLEIAVDAVESVGFDLQLPGLGSDLLLRLAELEQSLDDGRGAAVTDLDDPDEADGDGEHTIHLGNLPLFGPGGPSVGDLNQGGLGDCWFLAALNSLADGDPERLRDMVVDNGDGTYTVHFPDGSVTVDDEFYAGGDSPLYASGPGGGKPEVLWPLVFEKAAAQHFGGDFDDLDGGWPEDAFEALGANVDRQTLNPSFRFDPSDSDVADNMATALADGRPITADSGGAFGMGGAHAWSVTDIDTSTETSTDTGAQIWQVTVRNPWGHAGIRLDNGTWKYGDGTEVDFADDGDGDRISVDPTTGEITMPIDVFTANFDHIDVVEDWEDGS